MLMLMPTLMLMLMPMPMLLLPMQHAQAVLPHGTTAAAVGAQTLGTGAAAWTRGRRRRRRQHRVPGSGDCHPPATTLLQYRARPSANSGTLDVAGSWNGGKHVVPHSNSLQPYCRHSVVWPSAGKRSTCIMSVNNLMRHMFPLASGAAAEDAAWAGE